MSKMKTTKRINITREMIDAFVPGCPYNNPIAIALKEHGCEDASEIIVTADEIYIDQLLYLPTLEMTRWINDWNAGKRVQPSILGYHEPYAV